MARPIRTTESRAIPEIDDHFRVRDARSTSWCWVERAVLDRFGAKMGPDGIAVYLALARFCNERTMSANPRISKIAEITGVSERQVQRVIHTGYARFRSLVELGLVRVEERNDAASVFVLLALPENLHETPTPCANSEITGVSQSPVSASQSPVSASQSPVSASQSPVSASQSPLMIERALINEHNLTRGGGDAREAAETIPDPPPQKSDDDERWTAAICECCAIELHDESDRQAVTDLATRLRLRKCVPADVIAFGRWWRDVHWRGTTPTLIQVGRDWPKFAEWRRRTGRSAPGSAATARPERVLKAEEREKRRIERQEAAARAAEERERARQLVEAQFGPKLRRLQNRDGRSPPD